MKDDFFIGNVGNDLGFFPKKEKKKKSSNVSLKNDFGFKPLNLDFGFSSPVGKEPQIAPKAKASQNDFGMIGLGGMFSGSTKTIKMPKKVPTPQNKIEEKYKIQAYENKIKAKYGIKPAKNTAIEPPKPSLREKVESFKAKRYEEKMLKAKGIPTNYAQKIEESKEKARIEAKAQAAANAYSKIGNDEPTKLSHLEKVKAKLKKQNRIKYRFTITKKDGSGSKTIEENKLEDAQNFAGMYRSQGFTVSPIQQVIF